MDPVADVAIFNLAVLPADEVLWILGGVKQGFPDLALQFWVSPAAQYNTRRDAGLALWSLTAIDDPSRFARSALGDQLDTSQYEPVIVVGATRMPDAAAKAQPGSSTVPISIYLADDVDHEQVEAAVDDLAAAADLHIETRDDPVIGSWFRRMRATFKETVQTPAGREAVLTATHAADSRLILAQDAQVTAMMLQNLGPVLASLQPTRDAVLRIGALLIVKVDWVVQVIQLTAAQQAVLDHRPELATKPHEIVAALRLRHADTASAPTPEPNRGSAQAQSQ